MKKNEYVIYNRALDNMLRFTTGEVIIYGNKQEAVDDLYGDEEVVLIKDLSLRNQQIISDQLEEAPILGGRMKELDTEDLRNELAERGFQTANLWHIDDVLKKYNCSKEDALDIIRTALNHPYVKETVFDVIDDTCDAYDIKKEEVMKENKLIAEFMGYSPVSGVYVSRKDEFHIDEMQYDISWDWLMPVVEKCYESGAEENEVGDITHALLDCDIKETHKAVVEFIKELNK